MSRFDYLAIGHVTYDIIPSGYAIGGTAAYAGYTAHILGCRTAVLTSAGPGCEIAEALPELTVACVAAEQTTTFENRHDGHRRQQFLYRRAEGLRAEHLPEGWQRTPIVHLGPVADEVDPEMVHLFSNSLVGLSPQGWMRRWDEQGQVSPHLWDKAESISPLVAAVILSEEDLPERALLAQYRHWARLLVVTHGPDGCTVYMGEDERSFAAPSVPVVDPTGAGDIFAAAFLVRLFQTRGNPWEAAGFANHLASQSVTRSTLPEKIEHLKRITEVD